MMHTKIKCHGQKLEKLLNGTERNIFDMNVEIGFDWELRNGVVCGVVYCFFSEK